MIFRARPGFSFAVQDRPTHKSSVAAEHTIVGATGFYLLPPGRNVGWRFAWSIPKNSEFRG